MEPELHSPPDASQPPDPRLAPLHALQQNLRDGRDLHGVEWLLLGDNGLRVGWAVALFASLYYLVRLVAGTLFYSLGLIGDTYNDAASAVILSETVPLLGLMAATACMALIERRSPASYHLAGPRNFARFLLGLVSGFGALSVLVGVLTSGGWMHLSPSNSSVPQALRFALLWGLAFLLVALVEEGLFRCYALFTLTRGINFWWALTAQLGACAYLAWQRSGNGVWGVYLAAALGFVPCLLLHRKATARNGFWQATWITSTVFALYHTGNNGETWIGIFAAAWIAFVFCVSVYLTGSVWWAVGCHAAWDWAETYFYGTADSGLQGQGHLFSAFPAGNPLWSGGSDGPEGSLFVLAVIFLLLLLLLVLYWRKPPAAMDNLLNNSRPDPA